MNHLKEYTIVFVPGFLAQIYEGVSNKLNALSTERLINAAKSIPVIGGEVASLIPKLELPVDKDSGKSFFQQEKGFKDRGIECVSMGEVSTFNTQSGIAHNGAAIREILGKMGSRKVLIVSHSKGGLDTLEALINSSGSELDSVHGWLSIQAPFGGSPLADGGSAILPFIKMEALEDLKVAVRSPYMGEHSERITAIAKRIPITSAYSTYQAAPGDAIANAALELARHIIDPSVLVDIANILIKNAKAYWYWPPAAATHDISDAVSLISARFNQATKDVLGNLGLMDFTNLIMTGQPNDGLVPEESAKLVGAENSELSPHTDHAGPVMNVTPFRNFWSAKQRIDDLDARLTRLIERPTTQSTQPA